MEPRAAGESWSLCPAGGAVSGVNGQSPLLHTGGEWSATWAVGEEGFREEVTLSRSWKGPDLGLRAAGHGQAVGRCGNEREGGRAGSQGRCGPGRPGLGSRREQVKPGPAAEALNGCCSWCRRHFGRNLAASGMIGPAEGKLRPGSQRCHCSRQPAVGRTCLSSQEGRRRGRPGFGMGSQRGLGPLRGW